MDEKAYVVIYHDGDERREELIHATNVVLAEGLVVFVVGGMPVLIINASCLIKMHVLDSSEIDNLL